MLPRPVEGTGAMRITEIYASVQGETRFSGLPCTLVRTTGCDLRCTYCDTAYAFYGGREMSLEDIVAEVQRLGAPLVLLTGGEPMLQRDIGALAGRLLDLGYQVMIETSGAHPVDSLPEGVVRIVDVKTPASGESARVRWEVLDGLRPVDAIKFVVADERDYLWAAATIRERRLGRGAEVLLSPVHGRLDPRDLVAWMLRDRLPARLNLQIHKYIWGAETQGV
jgi:7-carboxy-7-deazaguanine synthase